MKNLLLLLSFLLFGITVRLGINFTDGIIIVLHNNISFTSTFNSDVGATKGLQTQTLVNGSLTELIRVYEEYNSNNNNNNNKSGVVSFLKQPFNFVLGEYFPVQNFQEFNVDHPIVSFIL